MTKRVVPTIALVGIVLFALAVLTDGTQVLDALRAIPVSYVLAALAIVSLSYLIRLARWEYYLHAQQIAVPTRLSAVVFFSGLSMAITPGKLGEMVKCFMLRDANQTPVASTAPVVIAERFSDLAAVLLLGSIGVFALPSMRFVLAAGAVLIIVAFVMLVYSPKAVDRVGTFLSRRILKGQSIDWAAESSQAFRRLLTGSRLLVGVVLGVAAWLAEGVAFCVLVRGFGFEISLFEATFIYAAGTLAGALSMLPGGLGVTEASLAGLLVAAGMPLATASAATLIVRACTLWWGVLIGFVFYATHLALVRGALSEVYAAQEPQS